MARSAKLSLQQLSDRIVPAVIHDLTTAGAEAVANGALVQQLVSQPAAGTYDPFVQIQGSNSKKASGVEQGYNTSARPLQFDEKSNTDVTHNLTLASVPVVIVNGVAYREFLLNVNQQGNSPLLSLDEVRIFTDTRESLASYETSTMTFAGQSAKFDLDAGGDVTIILNDSVNPIDQYGDMRLLVPESNFAGVSASDFVYLYSKMGGIHVANGGAEEWAVRINVEPPPPPPAGTSSLSGGVYFDELQDRLEDGQYDGLVGITINLTGTDYLGNEVDMSTVTAPDGSYQFTNLNAGTYSIRQVDQPTDYLGFPIEDGADYWDEGIGGGFSEEDDDLIINIDLGDDMHGVGYDFTEKYVGGNF